MKHLALVALLASALAVPAAAQITICSTPNGSANASCTGNVASSLTIPILLRLTIDDTSTTITPPTETDYNNLQSGAITGPVATVKTNNSWTLLVRATAATWTGTGGASATKAVGDLLWSTASGGTYTAMSTTNATAATGTRGVANVASIFYKVKWTWATDKPGTYTLTVIFTATAP